MNFYICSDVILLYTVQALHVDFCTEEFDQTNGDG